MTRKATETKDAISTSLLRLYNMFVMFSSCLSAFCDFIWLPVSFLFCSCHRSVVPYCLKIGLAGDEQFYSHVLQAFVDTAAKKTVNWPELVRFIPIHLGQFVLIF